MDSKFNTRLTPLVLGLLIVGLTACGGGGGSGDSGPAAPQQTATASSWETLEKGLSASMYQNPYTHRIYLTLANVEVNKPLVLKTSDDEGATWTTRSLGPISGINTLQIGCIMPTGRILTRNGYSDDGLYSLIAYGNIDYPTTNKIYCADNDIILGLGFHRLEISRDQGQSWTDSQRPPELRISNSFTPVRTQKGTFFVPGTTGILRSFTDPSLDDGLNLNWSLISLGDPVSSVVYNRAQNELTAVTIVGDIFYSTDDGLTWQPKTSIPEGFIDLQKGGTYYGYMLVAPEPIIGLAEDGELVVSGIIDTADNPTTPALKAVTFSSSDQGKTWDRLPDLDSDSSQPAPFIFISDNYYWMQFNGWTTGVAVRLAR